MKSPLPHHRSSRHRTAFTLVEMLVAVALVLLIMSMFAQIFQLAAGSISVQQGIAENDQQARMIAGLIRGDLEKRSMRLVLPFEADEDTRDPAAQLELRQGYFYYAENDPASKIDDVLQFTTFVNLQQQLRNTAPLVGLANSFPNGATNAGVGAVSRINITGIDTSGPSAQLVVAGLGQLVVGGKIWVVDSENGVNDGPYQITAISGSNLGVTPPLRSSSLTTFGQVAQVSEPEFDDGVSNNALGTSVAAEVSYFLRGNNLYRRVLLIRPGETLDDAQPQLPNGRRAIWVGGSTGHGNYPINNLTTSTFWRDFDYSAFHFPGKTTSSTSGVGAGVMFHATGPGFYNGRDGESLVLDDSDPANILTVPVSLGFPHWRFGHNPETGLPREYVDLDGTPNDMRDDSIFMGRFLAQETSSLNFGYPGRRITPFGTLAGGTQNPYARTFTGLNGGLSHVIDDYEDSPAIRRGDDIVMTNVLSFDVKLRDPRSGFFVDLGDTTSGANLSFLPASTASDIRNPYYSQSNRFRFDTWHPQARVFNPFTNNTNDTNSNPPFRTLHTTTGAPLPITSIQITIVYQNRVDGRIRQVTIEQSLLDHP